MIDDGREKKSYNKTREKRLDSSIRSAVVGYKTDF